MWFWIICYLCALGLIVSACSNEDDILINFCIINGIISFIVIFGYLFYSLFSYLNIPL